jgi:hypothetical protein
MQTIPRKSKISEIVIEITFVFFEIFHNFTHLQTEKFNLTTRSNIQGVG